MNRNINFKQIILLIGNFPNVLIFVLDVGELYRKQQHIQNQQKSEKEEVEDFY